MNGSLWLKANRDSLFLRLDTTAWMQIALYLFTFRSNTNTLPSVVTAANTVLEYGAHLTSPTDAPRSKMNRGSLEVGRREGKRSWVECSDLHYLLQLQG